MYAVENQTIRWAMVFRRTEQVRAYPDARILRQALGRAVMSLDDGGDAQSVVSHEDVSHALAPPAGVKSVSTVEYVRILKSANPSNAHFDG